MTMQKFREKIAEHRGALMGADAAFATEVNKRYDALKAKASNPHPADLRRLQNDIAKWASAYSARKDCSQDAFEAALAWRDLLQAEIDLQVFTATAGPETTGNGSGWVNAQTGEPIRLYAPDERIADERGRRDGPRLGAFLEGLIFGARTPEIKNALEEGTDSAGGYSVPTWVVSPFIDRLRAKTQFINAGARVMMLDGKTRIVRTDTDPVAAWRAESAAIAEGQPSFSAVDLVPKSLAVLVKVSREVLQDSVNIQDALEASLIGAMSGELDRAALFGAGTVTEPRGLFNVSGINSVSMGTNGATPTNYDNLLDCVYELELDNSADATAAIWHPRTARTFRKLKTRPISHWKRRNRCVHCRSSVPRRCRSRRRKARPATVRRC